MVFLTMSDTLSTLGAYSLEFITKCSAALLSEKHVFESAFHLFLLANMSLSVNDIVLHHLTTCKLLHCKVYQRCQQS